MDGKIPLYPFVKGEVECGILVSALISSATLGTAGVKGSR
jgi:hypothetical protein